jgi:hypothetical protein
VGDVHGELDALKLLLDVMGYSDAGIHPQGRKLVFVGDLTDRGPDSPGVIDFVDRLVTEGLGFCVLGNHDLNLLLGEKKYDNGWFFGDEFEFDGQLIPQVLADEQARAKTLDLFRRLPIAMEGDGMQIVHAFWNQESVNALSNESNVVEVFQQHVTRINAKCENDGSDSIDRSLRHQNDNPVKLLTSGPERRSASTSSGRNFSISVVCQQENRV